MAAEVVDWRRFTSARAFMGFTGLVPAEYSSGDRTRLGSITKAASAAARTALIEAARAYRYKPAIGVTLRRRQRDASPQTLARSWQAQRRLHGRYKAMTDCGTPAGVAVAAIARGEDRSQKYLAEDFLRKSLADGPRPSRDVEEEAREVHGIKKRTLDRARRDLKIPAKKRGTDWHISLPEHEGDLHELARSPSPAKTAKDATVGTVGNHAKDANSAPNGEVGNVGILPRDPGPEPESERRRKARVAEWIAANKNVSASEAERPKENT